MFWIALVLLGAATAFDLKSREIPDVFPVALLVLAALACTFGWTGVGWSSAGLGLILALGIGLLLFKTGGFGGGDVKLLIGLGALLGPKAFLLTLLFIALAGGVLSLVALARGQKDLAYGPAITLGFLVLLLLDLGWGNVPTS